MQLTKICNKCAGVGHNINAFGQGYKCKHCDGRGWNLEVSALALKLIIKESISEVLKGSANSEIEKVDDGGVGIDSLNETDYQSVMILLKEWIECTDEADNCPSMLLSSRHSDEATDKAIDIMKRLKNHENDLREATKKYFKKKEN